MKCGCYLIRNVVNGHCYAGSSLNVPARLKEHRADLHKGRHDNRYLQAAFRKYGEAAFIFYQVLVCDPGTRTMYEKLLIDRFGVYNLAKDPELPGVVQHRSASFKEKRRKVMLGNQQLKGFHHSVETIAEMKRTRKRTAAQRLAQSEKMKVIRAARPWSTRQLSNA